MLSKATRMIRQDACLDIVWSIPKGKIIHQGKKENSHIPSSESKYKVSWVSFSLHVGGRLLQESIRVEWCRIRIQVLISWHFPAQIEDSFSCKTESYNVPNVAPDQGTLWNIHALVHIIFRQSMWETWVRCQLISFDLIVFFFDSHALSGTGTVHLKVSIYIASTYGNDARSANVGSRSVPTTASISSCAFFCTSGYCVITRRKLVRAAIVFYPGKPIRQMPAKKEKS